MATGERIYEEATPKGHLAVTAYPHDGDARLRVEMDGQVVADAYPAARPSAGALLTVGRVDFTGERGRAIKAALAGYTDAHAAEIEATDETSDDERATIARDEAAARRLAAASQDRPAGVTGAEADIEANYPGGLAAFRRDERPDRTPHHKGEIAGY